MERKLASIQQIGSIDPIPGADFIVKARVMGWDVVVKKDEFQVGDLCVFFEVDSVLPDGKDWAEFMRPRKFRVRTVRLRKVLSQGLALPLDIIDDCDEHEPHVLCSGYAMDIVVDSLHEVGRDVTELLGVKSKDAVPYQQFIL